MFRSERVMNVRERSERFAGREAKPSVRPFSPMFLREGFPQRSKSARKPLPEKDGPKEVHGCFPKPRR